jgi:uncharacterized SAM-binding protein YcdF (DUF218 family)
MVFSLHVWSQVKREIQVWFASPQRVLLPLAASYVMTMWLGTGRWKRLLSRLLMGLAVAYLVLISPIGAGLTIAGLDYFLPPDRGQSADAVVVLGRGRFLEQERSQKAAEFWHHQRVPLVLATGHQGEADRIVRYVVAEGVPQTAVIAEPYARTTEENAQFSAGLLNQIGAQRIILVTDTPHMLRSLLTFRSFGFEVIPEPIPLPSSLSSLNTTVTALREYAGLVSYALAGRFQVRTATAPLSKPQTSSQTTS